MYSRLIREYFSIPRPSITKKLLFEDFKSLYDDIDITYGYFCQEANKYTKCRTIKTGAADCNLSQIPMVILERIKYQITFQNVYSIDEKPFIPKKIYLNNVYLPKTYHGKVYKAIHNLTLLKPIYLLMAVSYKGIVLYSLSKEPYNTITFNSFLMKLTQILNKSSEMCYYLFDNARFHEIHQTVKDDMSAKNISFTKTAPSTCFFDPIEEVFGKINKKFLNLYYKKVLETGKYAPLTQNILKELIIEAIECSNSLFIDIFRHAVL